MVLPLQRHPSPFSGRFFISFIITYHLLSLRSSWVSYIFWLFIHRLFLCGLLFLMFISHFLISHLHFSLYLYTLFTLQCSTHCFFISPISSIYIFFKLLSPRTFHSFFICLFRSSPFSSHFPFSLSLQVPSPSPSSSVASPVSTSSPPSFYPLFYYLPIFYFIPFSFCFLFILVLLAPFSDSFLFLSYSDLKI